MIPTPTTPGRPLVDLQEVRTLHRHVHHLITRRTSLFEAFQRSADGRAVLAALDLIPALSDEIERLSALVAALRLDRANLTAAARATLAAHADGESDPLFYLRDELSAQASNPRTTTTARRYRHPYGGEAR